MPRAHLLALLAAIAPAILVGLALAFVFATTPVSAQALPMCHRSLGADHVEELVSFQSTDACAGPGMQPISRADFDTLRRSTRLWCQLQRGDAFLLYYVGDNDGTEAPADLRQYALGVCSGLQMGLGYQHPDPDSYTWYEQ